MKLYPEDGSGGGGAPAAADTTTGTDGGTAPATAPVTQGTQGKGTPTPKTYTEEEVAAHVRAVAAKRDDAWNAHLFDDKAGRDVLAKLAAHFGVTLTEKEKENIEDAAATGDDKDLTPREKAMLARLEKLEGVHKTAEETQKETQAQEAMDADIAHAAESVPYGRDPELNSLVQDLILAAMIDKKTPKGTPTGKLALGIQTGLEKVFANWAKKNGYIKDPNAAATQPMRGGVTTTAIGPGKEPKSWSEVEEETAAMIRAQRARK